MRVDIRHADLFHEVINQTYPGLDLPFLNGITIDSRMVKRGDMFLAMQGDNTDGNNYIKQAQDAGAAACIIEKDSDALMDRTKNRPIPTGTISVLNALIFGVLLSISGLFILYIHVNVLTFFIAFLTLFLYVFVYSPLKKISWFN